MRFYLSTFILVVLLLGALMAVWARREPWEKVGTQEPYKGSVELLKDESPDRTRKIDVVGRPGAIFEFRIENIASGEELFTFGTLLGYNAYFLSNNEVLVEDGFLNISSAGDPSGGPAIQTFQRYRRRHPEWWWGHFYRPEVWASIALFFSLILHIRHSRKQSEAGR